MKLYTFDLKVVMADGTIHESVRPTQIAQRAYERAAAKHQWPSFQEAPFTYFAFCAYHQLKAEGKYAGSFTQFDEKDCIAVEALEDDENNVELIEVNPTQGEQQPSPTFSPSVTPEQTPTTG